MDEQPITQLVEGLPRPPCWYEEMAKLLPTPSTSLNPYGEENFSYQDVTNEQIFARFPPPPIPNGNITAFGAPMVLDEIVRRHPLDSDTKLYFDSPDSSGVIPELRDEFGRLFEEMVEEIIYLMGQCSQLGMPVVTSVTSTSKKIIKIYRNLHHILSILRDFQFYDMVTARLKEQFDHKMRLINDVRQIVYHLSPLSSRKVLEYCDAMVVDSA